MIPQIIFIFVRKRPLNFVKFFIHHLQLFYSLVSLSPQFLFPIKPLKFYFREWSLGGCFCDCPSPLFLGNFLLVDGLNWTLFGCGCACCVWWALGGFGEKGGYQLSIFFAAFELGILTMLSCFDFVLTLFLLLFDKIGEFAFVEFCWAEALRTFWFVFLLNIFWMFARDNDFTCISDVNGPIMLLFEDWVPGSLQFLNERIAHMVYRLEILMPLPLLLHPPRYCLPPALPLPHNLLPDQFLDLPPLIINFLLPNLLLSNLLLHHLLLLWLHFR